MTTWRLESMWTRTLSTTISTRRPMGGLSTTRRRRTPETPHEHAHQGAGHEPADVGEERDASLGRGPAQAGHPVQELQAEPQPEDDQGGHPNELDEDPEEDERGDPGRRGQRDVSPERRRARARGPDERHAGGRVDQALRQRRDGSRG